MCTSTVAELGFNLILLLLSEDVFELAASNVGYIIFNFLNLQAGWIHRLDRPTWNRPFKAASWLPGIGAVLGFFNLALMGMGANVYGDGTLMAGLVFAARMGHAPDRGVLSLADPRRSASPMPLATELPPIGACTSIPVPA